MKLLLPNKKLLVLIISLTLVLVVLIIVNIRTQAPEQLPLPSPTQPLAVLSIIPPKGSILKPGEQQTFIIQFNQQTDSRSLNMEFSAKEITKDEPAQPLEFSTSLSGDNKFLTILPSAAIIPLHEYQINILDSTSGATIFSINYLSDNPPAESVQTNNLDLIQYLPHQTSSYTLNYIPSRNIYIFSFNFDPNSPDSIDIQYEKAKQDAINFIQEKGIDINSIVIEWRYS